jgi:enoyl-CoA hydratase
VPAAELEPEDAPGQVRVRRYGPVGRVTLDRPRQINALTLAMVQRIRAALLRWETNPRIERVLVDGHGERGFCAGGDIRVVHDAARDRTDAAELLWRTEYLLDALIADFRKPVVTVLDGIAMGGGIGLGGHASHRVVTERSVLAMPEVRIGISPDVGGLLLFARAPGLLGTHLALTGDRFGPGDALHLGFADAFVPFDRLGRLLPLLAEGSADEAVRTLRAPAPAAPLDEARSWIDSCYAGPDPVAIVAQLRAAGVPGAAAAADTIESVSPLAVCVTSRALAEARVLDSLPEVLAQDLRVGLRFLDGADPVEGIRAVLVDKEKWPAWSPPALAQVDPAQIDRHFGSLGSAELDVRRNVRWPEAA